MGVCSGDRCGYPNAPTSSAANSGSESRRPHACEFCKAGDSCDNPGDYALPSLPDGGSWSNHANTDAGSPLALTDGSRFLDVVEAATTGTTCNNAKKGTGNPDDCDGAQDGSLTQVRVFLA